MNGGLKFRTWCILEVLDENISLVSSKILTTGSV
jgi:hypothetical protein